MKIGELNDHCGNCKLIDYCTEPYETPHLCAYEELENIDEETYKQIAKNITEEEIEDKLRQYEENNISPWTDNFNGAICDVVLEKLKRRRERGSRNETDRCRCIKTAVGNNCDSE